MKAKNSTILDIALASWGRSPEGYYADWWDHWTRMTITARTYEELRAELARGGLVPHPMLRIDRVCSDDASEVAAQKIEAYEDDQMVQEGWRQQDMIDLRRLER